MNSYVYPSPARGDRASVAYELKEDADVRLRIYNEAGRLVDTIQEHKNGGHQSSGFNTAKLAPGAYFYALYAQYGSGSSELQPVRKFVVIH